MFPKKYIAILSIVAISVTVQAETLDCHEFVPIYQNDEELGFIKSDERIDINYETTGESQVLYKVTYPIYSGWEIPVATISYVVKSNPQPITIFSKLVLDESDGKYSSWFRLDDYLGQDITFVIDVSYSRENSCPSFVLEETWKHNQSNKAPASQAGTH